LDVCPALDARRPVSPMYTYTNDAGRMPAA
jgi:hypothetical protein